MFPFTQKPCWIRVFEPQTDFGLVCPTPLKDQGARSVLKPATFRSSASCPAGSIWRLVLRKVFVFKRIVGKVQQGPSKDACRLGNYTITIHSCRRFSRIPLQSRWFWDVFCRTLFSSPHTCGWLRRCDVTELIQLTRHLCLPREFPVLLLDMWVCFVEGTPFLAALKRNHKDTHHLVGPLRKEIYPFGEFPMPLRN